MVPLVKEDLEALDNEIQQGGLTGITILAELLRMVLPDGFQTFFFMRL